MMYIRQGYIMSSMYIDILDTGDNYIIAKKGQSCDTALRLYQLMNVTVNVIETGLDVSQDEAEFIFESLGRIMSCGFNDTDGSTRIDIPAKLVGDIKSAKEFFGIRKFWAGVAHRGDADEKIAQSLRSMPHLSSEEMRSGPLDVFDVHIQTPKEGDLRVSKKYVVFNTIYNIALVVDLSSAETFVAEFPEFVMVREVDFAASDKLAVALGEHFHKTSFANLAEVRKKYDAFLQLYNVTASDDGTEKTRVKACLDGNFIVSTDPEKRMKANDLYKEIINFMRVPVLESSVFKKRLAGYLLEFNLQKKRFSDAYYYYGITKKEPQPIDLGELEKKRDMERKAWIASVPASECIGVVGGCTLNTLKHRTTLDALGSELDAVA